MTTWCSDSLHSVNKVAYHRECVVYVRIISTHREREPDSNWINFFCFQKNLSGIISLSDFF